MNSLRNVDVQRTFSGYCWQVQEQNCMSYVPHGRCMDMRNGHSWHIGIAQDSAGISKRAGGRNATVTRGLWVRYLHEMIEGIKSNKPEVKASKLDKRLRSYGLSKLCMLSYWFSLAHEWCSRLLNAAQTSTIENFDVPETVCSVLELYLVNTPYVQPNSLCLRGNC